MIILIVVGVAALLSIACYNTLVVRRNQMANAAGTVDVMLKKRYDLIPTVVETVRQYAGHESSLLSKVTEMRSRGFDALSSADKAGLDRELKSLGSSLRLVAENYPDLKASENFMQLQRTLNETEEQLSAARRTYNAGVTAYNNSVMTFPTNLFAELFGFRPGKVIAIPDEERAAPDMKKLFGKR